ncbi:MAG: hypothetical protein IKK10_01260 [Clostridia bacterium]|nr:hypothetical protein [Clostridia bacterium]
MKKVIALLLVALIAFSLTACSMGKKDNVVTGTNAANSGNNATNQNGSGNNTPSNGNNNNGNNSNNANNNNNNENTKSTENMLESMIPDISTNVSTEGQR